MWILLGLLVVVLVEIVLLIQLGGAIGIWLTLLWIIVTAGLGVILLKGVASLGGAMLSYRMEEFQDVGNPMAHRGLVLIAGLFLILPGPLLDFLGVLLLFPPMRGLVIGVIARRLKNQRIAALKDGIIDGEWQDVSSFGKSGTADQGRPQS